MLQALARKLTGGVGSALIGHLTPSNQWTCTPQDSSAAPAGEALLINPLRPHSAQELTHTKAMRPPSCRSPSRSPRRSRGKSLTRSRSRTPADRAVSGSPRPADRSVSRSPGRADSPPRSPAKIE